jgi:predicted membrane protein
MKTKNIISVIVVIAVVALLGIGFYNKEVSWEVAIASITSVVVLVYNLNGWNKSEEKVEKLNEEKNDLLTRLKK